MQWSPNTLTITIGRCAFSTVNQYTHRYRYTINQNFTKQ